MGVTRVFASSEVGSMRWRRRDLDHPRAASRAFLVQQKRQAMLFVPFAGDVDQPLLQPPKLSRHTPTYDSEPHALDARHRKIGGMVKSSSVASALPEQRGNGPGSRGIGASCRCVYDSVPSAGITPSCCIIPISSVKSHISTILPPARR